jgi:hypothetical protein
MPLSVNSSVGTGVFSNAGRDLATSVDRAKFELRARLSDGIRGSRSGAPRLLPRTMVERVSFDDSVSEGLPEHRMIAIDESLEDW